ncbi:exonuclease domain-containing protein [Peribacillus kribbensis]|uniref:exonuclease domain-containing protein n=1 Tax=Peribacillus kribbensis TaxID=356658 RepID=UPI0003F95297|nr:exonuclease domain-containing protein [Peribacillus kribbensis]
MNYIVVDVERNSFKYETVKPSEIIEIGAVKILEDGTIADKFSALIKPSCPLSKFTTKLTHITDDDVRNAPVFKEVYPKFVEFLGEDYVFVSWGKEDYRFFEADCSRSGLQMFTPASHLDIQEVYMFGILNTFTTPSLAASLEALNIPVNEHSHRALSDAESTSHILLELKRRIDIHSVEKPKRYAEKQFFTDGRINSAGKRKYSKLIQSVLKKTQNEQITWLEFSSHPKWREYVEDFQVSPALESFYEGQFDQFKGHILTNSKPKETAKPI